MEEVIGSIPIRSTNHFNRLRTTPGSIAVSRNCVRSPLAGLPVWAVMLDAL
jgi:hypothetical protein